MATNRVVSTRGASVFRAHGISLAGGLSALHLEEPDTVPRSQAARFAQRSIRSRIRRSEGVGRTLEQRSHRGANRPCLFLCRQHGQFLYKGLGDIAKDQNLSIAKSARLFALSTLAIADAVISSWDSKRYYNFWRPLTAIREGDNDGNHHTVGDPTWEPFLNTPPYPDYTSGANNVFGAATGMLQLFFGTDELTFSLTTDHPLAIQKTRTYTRFSDLAQDVEDVRIYQGIHFRSADAEARKQGRQVAKWAFKHVLLPVND